MRSRGSPVFFSTTSFSVTPAFVKAIAFASSSEIVAAFAVVPAAGAAATGAALLFAAHPVSTDADIVSTTRPAVNMFFSSVLTSCFP